MKGSEKKARETMEVLGDRGAIYGPYRAGIDTRRKLMDTMLGAYKKHHGKVMPRHQQEYLWDVMNKMSRIAVCPNHIDSWHDVKGYATLIEADIIDSGDGI